MTLSTITKEKIAIEVIKTLITRFESFPTDASNNRNAPFHEAFLKAFSDKLADRVSDTPFFISLSSWLHGLNTTLGQQFFEHVAHHLSNGEKREYTSKKLGNLYIKETQKQHVNDIITNLSTSAKQPNLLDENHLLFQKYTSKSVKAIDFSADVFIEDEHCITAIEMKSVKPNSGEMRGEKQKILEGKAALYEAFPDKEIKFFIGFPFDPTVDPIHESVTSFDKTRFLGSIINMTKYFAFDETLVASELWDILSGQSHTMEEILEIINTIATHEFISKYQLLTDTSKRLTPEYCSLLSEWFLTSELKLIEYDAVIQSKVVGNKDLTRIYNKMSFDSKGNYDRERYNELMKIIN